jgi:hypothetical protein
MGKIRDKFHSYLEKYRCAIVAERDFGPHHPTTVSYYEIANAAKLQLQSDLDEAERYIDELISSQEVKDES